MCAVLSWRNADKGVEQCIRELKAGERNYSISNQCTRAIAMETGTVWFLNALKIII